MIFILDARGRTKMESSISPLLTTMVACCVVNISCMLVIYIAFLFELCLKDRDKMLTHEFEQKKVAYLGYAIDIVSSVAALVCGTVLFKEIGLGLLVSYTLLVFASTAAIHLDLSEMNKVSKLDNPKRDSLLKELKDH